MLSFQFDVSPSETKYLHSPVLTEFFELKPIFVFFSCENKMWQTYSSIALKDVLVSVSSAQ